MIMHKRLNGLGMRKIRQLLTSTRVFNGKSESSFDQYGNQHTITMGAGCFGHHTTYGETCLGGRWILYLWLNCLWYSSRWLAVRVGIGAIQ
jgi:hypothetical protein